MNYGICIWKLWNVFALFIIICQSCHKWNMWSGLSVLANDCLKCYVLTFIECAWMMNVYRNVYRTRLRLWCSTETETEHIKSMSTCKIIWLCWSLSLWTKCRKNYGKLVAVTYLKAENSEGTGGTVRRGGMQSQLVPGPGLVCPGLWVRRVLFVCLYLLWFHL